MQISRDEFERLALEQIDLVDRLARSLARDSAEADDLVQETYVRAIRGWPTFDLREHGIRPWLFRILHNLFLSRRGRESRQPAPAEQRHLESGTSLSDGVGMSDVERWEAGEELRQAMAELPADLRIALELWAVEEFTYQEIADAFQVPIGTVMSRLHRAKRLLREAYERRARIVRRPTSYIKDAQAKQ